MQKADKTCHDSFFVNTELYIHDELDRLLKSRQRFVRLQDGLGLLVRREISQVISPRQDRVFVIQAGARSIQFTGGFDTLEEAYHQATRILNHGALLQTAYKGIFPENTSLSNIEKLARCAHISVQKPPMPNHIVAQLYKSILQTK